MGFKPEAALNTLQYEMVRGIENACRDSFTSFMLFVPYCLLAGLYWFPVCATTPTVFPCRVSFVFLIGFHKNVVWRFKSLIRIKIVAVIAKTICLILTVYK
jgi:hypothetical protein